MTLISWIKEFDCLLVHTAVSGLVDSCGHLVGVVPLVTQVLSVSFELLLTESCLFISISLAFLGGSSQDFRSRSRFLRMLTSSLASLLGFLTTYPDLGLSLLRLTSPFLLLASTFERDRDLALAGASFDACDGDDAFAVVVLPSGSDVDDLFLSSSNSNLD